MPMYKYKMEKNKIYKKTRFKSTWKEISKEDYLTLVEKNDSIISDTLNFNLFKYLDDKFEVDFYSEKSTFGQSVHCEIIEWKENLIQTMDGHFCGDLNIKINIRSSTNNELLSLYSYNMFIKINKKISKKLIEFLFERAFSGIYENPWLEEDIYKEMQKCGLIPKTAELSYCCSECNRKFNSLKELLSHLIEENHYDDILYRYRKYPEFKVLYDKLNKKDNRKEIRD